MHILHTCYAFILCMQTIRTMHALYAYYACIVCILCMCSIHRHRQRRHPIIINLRHLRSVTICSSHVKPLHLSPRLPCDDVGGGWRGWRGRGRRRGWWRGRPAAEPTERSGREAEAGVGRESGHRVGGGGGDGGLGVAWQWAVGDVGGGDVAEEAVVAEVA